MSTSTMKANGDGGWQDVRVSLGPDAEVSGKLSFVVPTRIEGKLKGEVRASDLLVIGPQAADARGGGGMAVRLPQLGADAGRCPDAAP